MSGSPHPQYEFVVLKSSDADLVLNLERQKLAEGNVESMEIELLSWHAPWRRESLDHYLPMGWSFGAWSAEGELAAYFLAQPLLFFRQMTQSLWVEHLTFPKDSPELGEQLIDLAYRLSREKHLQKLLLAPSADLQTLGGRLDAWRPSPVDEGIVEIKTAKL